MALEEYFESEVGIAIAATAIAFSPKARALLRQGAVYGLAALMKAGDAASAAARGVATEVQSTAAAGVDAAHDTAAEARTVSKGGKAPRTNQTG